MRYGQRVQQKRRVQKEALDASRCSEFDFKPRINQRSRSIANLKRHTKPIDKFNQRQYIVGENFQNASKSRIDNVEGMQPYQEDNHNKSHLVMYHQDQSFLNNSNCCSGNVNQTQMPGGDDDDDIEDMCEEEHAFGNDMASKE